MIELKDYMLHDLRQRVERLEEKAFGKKKPPITLSQQILVLDNLGMLQKIRELDISNVKKAKLLATILKSDESNTKKTIEALAKTDDNSIKTVFNYEYLSKLFEEIGMENNATEIDKLILKQKTAKEKF